jgi:hypothetical protein
MSAEWKISGIYTLLLALDLNRPYLIQNTSCANYTNCFFSLYTYLTANTTCPNYANCFISLCTYLTENMACPNYEDQHWQEVINLCQVFL